MSALFDFGDPPYNWDEFERFVDWWVGPTAIGDLVPESALSTHLPNEFRRWFHLWGNRPQVQGRFYRFWNPDREHYLANGLIVIGREDEGDCRRLAIDPVEDKGFIELGEYSSTYVDERWNVAYSSVNEMLVRTTMFNLFGKGLDPSFVDEVQAPLLVEVTPNGSPTRFFYHCSGEHLYQRTEPDHGGYLRFRRPTLPEG